MKWIRSRPEPAAAQRIRHSSGPALRKEDRTRLSCERRRSDGQGDPVTTRAPSSALRVSLSVSDCFRSQVR